MARSDGSRRITQRDIARLAGVSQTTVSLVLNNRAGDTARIPAQTRERVLQVIRETGYVADPIARRLVDRHNRIFGVFTYEPVFPSQTADFYHPFLVGIEECAEALGCDLLLFTSAPSVGGRRRIYQEGNRLRLADGCVLLGRELDRDDLARLVAERQPFVSVGRREDAGGRVPYVGADYAAATAELVRRAVALGHRRLAYLGDGEGPESFVDRFRGFTDGVADAGAYGARHRVPEAGAGALLPALLDDRITAVFLEEYADGAGLAAAARERGLAIPADLSVIALGHPTRPAAAEPEPPSLTFTGFRIPRREMGWRAVELLAAVIEGTANQQTWQQLLPCEPVDGATLAPPAVRQPEGV
ncbi:MAG TPA: LacI family DNA-binding transcriptional regulator [Natronosporangium sp.]